MTGTRQTTKAPCLGALIVVLLWLACPAPSWAQTSGALEAKIVSGSLTSDYLTTVALLSGTSQSTATSYCTATLIGCSTLLTAAHCVCSSPNAPCQGGDSPDPGDYLAFFQHYGFVEVSAIVVNASYDPSSLEGDLALITLSEAVAGIAPTPLATATPALGTRARIAGFGRGGGSDNDYGLKRYGEVTTVSCLNGSSASLCWNFACNDLDNCDDSNTCNGDSGGPLFVTEDDGEVLAGVTSSGTNFQCLAEDHSYDTSVVYWMDWITGNAGETLGADTCGDAAHIGTSARVQVVSASGSLAATGATTTEELTVTDGTGELRVAVNAEDSGAENFSVYVKQGAPPTASDNDCAAAGSSQYAFCQFANPATGSWYVNITSVEGGGQWQLTSTHINAGSGSACGDPGGEGSVVVTDALAILRKSVGIAGQCRYCHCDIDANGSVTVTDALLALKTALGIDVTLDCLACVDSTTTTTLP